MEKTKKYPKLRFPEFSEDWEQRKLGEMGETFTGLSGKTKDDFGKGTAKYITYMNVFSNSISSLDGIDLIEIDDKQNQVKYGDVLFTTSSETPNEVGMSSVWLGTEKNVYLNSFCFGYRPLKHVDPYYFGIVLRSPSVRAKFVLLAQGVSRYNISKVKAMDIDIPLPTIEEQNKIGAFFQEFDKLIAIHQRKLEVLKEQKKGLLQQMFPKDGANIPELRFPEFTGAWEQRKFKDMLDSAEGIRRGPFGSALKKEFFVTESDFVVYEQQNAIYDRFETRYNISLEKFNELHRFEIKPGDFIMSGAGTIGRISRVPAGIKRGVFNQALIRIKINNKKTDSDFFIQLMRAEKMQKKLTEANPASAVTNLVPMSEVKEWDITFPSLEEQAKIGAFFQEFDNIIAIHQRKLEALQEQKKGLLQQMFV